jgi:hypothetical protein
MILSDWGRYFDLDPTAILYFINKHESEDIGMKALLEDRGLPVPDKNWSVMNVFVGGNYHVEPAVNETK